MKIPKFNKELSWDTCDKFVVSFLGATAITAFIVMPSIPLKDTLKFPLTFVSGLVMATVLHKKEIFE